MEKVLVIRYGTIGDTIFASAFYRELRKNLPNSQIDALVDSIAEGIMRDCPYVNNLIPLRGKYLDFFYYFNLFRQYDTIFFLKNDNFLSKTAFIAGVKNRIGFDVKRNFMLTKTAPYNNDKHEIDFYLDLLKICDFTAEENHTEIWTGENNNPEIEKLLQMSNKKIILHASSRIPQKNWIPEHWAKVLDYLVNTLQAQVIFVGGNKDSEYYDNILNLTFDLNLEPINLCGKLSISDTLYLVKNADFMIGIDSGIIHMAAGAGIPSILLNGPTSLLRWKPRSEKCSVISKDFECSPCVFASSRNKRCRNKESECMRAINPDEVISAIWEKFC